MSRGQAPQQSEIADDLLAGKAAVRSSEKPSASVPQAKGHSWFAVAVTVGAGATVLDQVSKALARSMLHQDTRIPLIGDLLGLQLTFNPGTILSLGSGATWVFTMMSAIAVIILGPLAARARSKGWAIALGLIWGGALGNLIDRILGQPLPGLGHVTDFLSYGSLFIGNLADIALVIGVAAAMYLAWRDNRSQPSPPGGLTNGTQPAGDGHG